jgi:Tetratricopeptide repeat
MTADLQTLQRRALDLIKKADFGPESIALNAEIVELSPKDDGAWTRLGRCYLEQQRFDEAVTALRTALSLNPSKTVAMNLLAEVRKRRALSPSATARAGTGFTAREFALIETLTGDELLQALRPRMEVLFDVLNATSIAEKIVSARHRNGETGSKLYQMNSLYPGTNAGHLQAFHFGGRWEPQFNLGWFAPPVMASCMRIGIGFNLSSSGRDPDRGVGQQQVLRYFERFQQVVAKSWQRELARWMAATGGFVQYGSNQPDFSLLPDRAVERLVSCQNPIAVEWIFLGRWLFLDKSDDAKILGDRSKLAAAVDDTFRTLFPLWLTAYGGIDAAA